MVSLAVALTAMVMCITNIEALRSFMFEVIVVKGGPEQNPERKYSDYGQAIPIVVTGLVVFQFFAQWFGKPALSSKQRCPRSEHNADRYEQMRRMRGRRLDTIG